MTPSKEAIEAAQSTWFHDGENMELALKAAYAIDFAALQQENERLAKTITDFQDVTCIQERQIFALHSALKEAESVIQLMHDSMTMPARDFYDKWVETHGKHFNMSVQYKRSLTTEYLEKRQARAALTRAEEVLGAKP